VLALLVLAWVFWMHGRCCPYACHGMGRPGAGCPYHGGMMSPPDTDGSAPGEIPSPAPDPSASDKSAKDK
jgi:hypothetical protein